MAQRWIVTALGQDRPGIVAGVTQILFQLGCNLEDSAMTRLEGEFTIMLILSAPAAMTRQRLERSFAPLGRQLGLAVHLKPLSAKEGSQPKARGARHVISVYGADRPGIVFKVSELLARAGLNITDVHTHRSTGRAPSLYLLLLEVEVPARLRLASIEQRLRALAKRLRVEVSMRPADVDVL